MAFGGVWWRGVGCSEVTWGATAWGRDGSGGGHWSGVAGSVSGGWEGRGGVGSGLSTGLRVVVFFEGGPEHDTGAPKGLAIPFEFREISL